MNRMETIGIAMMQNIGVARMTNIGMAYSLNVGMVMNTVVGKQLSEQIGETRSTSVGKNDTLQVGDTLKVGAKTIQIQAESEIVLACGSSTIKLTPGQIEILGPLVKINC
jgi:type VI secretion system secreted protein VgrG